VGKLNMAEKDMYKKQKQFQSLLSLAVINLLVSFPEQPAWCFVFYQSRHGRDDLEKYKNEKRIENADQIINHLISSECLKAFF
jgi:hypothetical protein